MNDPIVGIRFRWSWFQKVMQDSKHKLGKIAFGLTIMMIISKCLGVMRDALMAYKFGTSYIVDVYTVGLTFGNLAFSLFTVGFSEAFITVFARTNPKERTSFFNNTVTLILLGTTVLGCFFFVFSDTVARFLAPGFDSGAHNLLILFIRIMCFVIPIQGVFAILLSNEQARENFVFTRFCDFIVINVLVIITILITDSRYPFFLPIGYVIANFVALISVAIYSIKNGNMHYSFRCDLKDKSFNTLLSLAIPLGVSFLINDINTMSDGIFASMVGEGMTSSLNYANKMQALFLAVTINIISSVCFPRIAGFFSSGEKEKALYYIRKSIMIALFIAIPFTFFLILFSPLVVKVIFERGSFNKDSSYIVANCLRYYCFGIPFYAMNNVQCQVLAADAKQKIIMIITSISVACNIVLDFVLLKLIGYIGLPLATALSGTIQFCILAFYIKKMGLVIVKNEEKKDILRILVSILVSMVLTLATYTIWGSRASIWLGIGRAAFFMALYICINYLIRTNIFMWLIKSLLKKR